MFKYILAIIFIIQFKYVEAGFFPRRTHFADQYSQSIEKRFGLDLSRIRQLSDFIYIAHPSLLKKWGVINNDAEATYNSWLKTIEIAPNLTVNDANQNMRLLSLEEMEKRNILTYNAAVVFHELSHAELDVIIEHSDKSYDLILKNLFDYQVIPWFEKYYSEFDADIAVSELFAYYQEEALNFLMQEQQAIYLENGIDIQKQKCFIPRAFNDKLLTQSKEEFQQLQLLTQQLNYSEQIHVPTIFVQSDAIDLVTKQNPFPISWWKVLWSHFKSTYKSVENREQMIQFLNQKGPYKKLIAECRSQYWDRLHKTTEQK